MVVHMYRMNDRILALTKESERISYNEEQGVKMIHAIRMKGLSPKPNRQIGVSWYGWVIYEITHMFRTG